MAKRDNTFLLVAAGLAFVAWQLFKPKHVGAAPATAQDGTTGGAIAGSPNQVLYRSADFAPFNYAATYRLGV